MEALWGTALSRQFGVAIDMLERALVACPDALWTERLWPATPPPYFPAQFAEFWYVSYHTLVWLDLYLAGRPEEEFAPPAPFRQGEVDSHEALPDRPYTKEEVLGYLAVMRQKSQTTLIGLTEEQARRPVEYGWTKGKTISQLELHLYNLRHLQERAAQLSLFLGQRTNKAE
jgi:hypothetical protein